MVIKIKRNKKKLIKTKNPILIFFFSFQSLNKNFDFEIRIKNSKQN